MATPLARPGHLGAASSTTRRRAFRELPAAGLIGSSTEWYDFFLYGTAAALVFPRVFFPHSSALTGTLLAFSTFWAGFVARPIGLVLAVYIMVMGLITFAGAWFLPETNTAEVRGDPLAIPGAHLHR